MASKKRRPTALEVHAYYVVYIEEFGRLPIQDHTGRYFGVTQRTICNRVKELRRRGLVATHHGETVLAGAIVQPGDCNG